MDTVHKKNRPARGAALRRGGYLAGVTVAAVVVVLLINMIVGQLPSHLRELDMTDNSLYEVSDTSRDFLSTLDKDVEIVVLAEEGTVDGRIEKYLDGYVACSSRITLTQVDPVAHPTAAAQYEADSNSLVVLCEETGKQKVISFGEIITYTMDYMTFSYQESQFDAEGQLTSAIAAVTGENSEKVYTTAGHNEASLPTQVTDAIAKANLDTGEVNLLRDGAIPEDCTLLLAYQPAGDLSEEELTLVEDYLAGGGQLMLVLPAEEADQPNWESLLNQYGLETVGGYVADTQQYYQQFRNPYYIYPVLDSSGGIGTTLSADAQILLVNTRGMNQITPARDTIAVTPFMTTSEGGVAVDGESQTQGTYVLGASATEETEGGTARLTVISAATLTDESILTRYSTSNLELFMSALTVDLESTSQFSIPAKSLAITYNTVVNAGLWSALFLFVIPVLVLLGGLIYWVRRRKL